MLTQEKYNNARADLVEQIKSALTAEGIEFTKGYGSHAVHVGEVQIEVNSHGTRPHAYNREFRVDWTWTDHSHSFKGKRRWKKCTRGAVSSGAIEFSLPSDFIKKTKACVAEAEKDREDYESQKKVKQKKDALHSSNRKASADVVRALHEQLGQEDGSYLTDYSFGTTVGLRTSVGALTIKDTYRDQNKVKVEFENDLTGDQVKQLVELLRSFE